MTATTVSTKAEGQVEHIDHRDEVLKPTPQHDKFGSAAKTDPREIALVRKIDLYMMVSLCVSIPPDLADRSSPFSG